MFQPGRIYNVITILFHVLIFNLDCAAQTWELRKSENGISVFSRNAPGSSFKELKSVMNINASLSSIVALINDWDSYPGWVYKCGKSTTIKRISETEAFHYQTVVAPWPIDSRDIVVHVKIFQDPATKIVKIQSTSRPDLIPAIKNFVRITEFNASWTLIPQKDGSVEVTYQLLVDPGGSVPAWLVNIAAVDGPFETSLKLREWVKKEKYQKAKLSYIIN